MEQTKLKVLDHKSPLSKSPEWDSSSKEQNFPQNKTSTPNPLVQKIVNAIKNASFQQKNQFKENHNKLKKFLLTKGVNQEEINSFDSMQWTILVAKALYNLNFED